MEEQTKAENLEKFKPENLTFEFDEEDNLFFKFADTGEVYFTAPKESLINAIFQLPKKYNIFSGFNSEYFNLKRAYLDLRCIINKLRDNILSLTKQKTMNQDTILDLMKKLSETAKENNLLKSGISEESRNLLLKLQSFEKTISKLQNELQEKTEAYKLYKDHLIEVHLGNQEDLHKETLNFLIKLFLQTKDFKQPKQEAEMKDKEQLPEQEIVYQPPEPKLSFEDSDPEFQNYVRTEKCFCGEEKKYGAIGCPDHKNEARRTNDRKQIGMREAWKEVYETYAESLRKV